jgi:hypothetical protein
MTTEYSTHFNPGHTPYESRLISHPLEIQRVPPKYIAKSEEAPDVASLSSHKDFPREVKDIATQYGVGVVLRHEHPNANGGGDRFLVTDPTVQQMKLGPDQKSVSVTKGSYMSRPAIEEGIARGEFQAVDWELLTDVRTGGKSLQPTSFIKVNEQTKLTEDQIANLKSATLALERSGLADKYSVSLDRPVFEQQTEIESWDLNGGAGGHLNLSGKDYAAINPARSTSPLATRYEIVDDGRGHSRTCPVTVYCDEGWLDGEPHHFKHIVHNYSN